MREEEKFRIMNKDPRQFTAPITGPSQPRLTTPFDDLLHDPRGRRITTKSQWLAKRKLVLAAFRSILGRFPGRPPALEWRELRRETLRKFERRKITIRVHADEVLTAYWCIPEKPLRGHPSVLCLPETHAVAHENVAGLHGMDPRAYGARLAEEGFVTLCPNHFVAGERTPKYGPFVTAEFYEKYPEWSAVGKAIWDNRICLNFLETLRGVNPERIGCMGHSLGAHSSVFLAALDQRVRCTVSNCGWSSFRCNPNRCHWSRDGWYVYFPTLRERFLKSQPAPVDFHEIGALVAPRPWLDISGLSDRTFPDGQHLPGMFIRIHEVYQLLRSPEQLAFYTHGGVHGLYEPSFALAAAWLKRWLADGGA